MPTTAQDIWSYDVPAQDIWSYDLPILLLPEKSSVYGHNIMD